MAASIKKNLPFLKQEFQVAVGESSVVVKFIGAAIILCYFLSFINGAPDHLTVKAGHPLAIWTFFTHSFFQFRIWHVTIDIIVCMLCGKLIEPLWGAFGLSLFYMIVNTLVGFFSMLTLLFVYMVTKKDYVLFDTYVHGLAGYIAGFTVAVKQMMPDNVLLNAPFGKVRNKHIPLLLLVITILGALSGALEGPYPIMFFWGIIISWIYLRFYQKHSNGTRGDWSETFNFASFFPSTLEPFVAILSNTIFNFMVKMKICSKPQRKYDVSSPTTIRVTLPGTEPRDAERRRQLALKALNERLTKTESQTSWPDMMDESTPSPNSPAPNKSSSSANTDKHEEVIIETDLKKEEISTVSEKDSSKSDKSIKMTLPVPNFKHTSQDTTLSFKQNKDGGDKQTNTES